MQQLQRQRPRTARTPDCPHPPHDEHGAQTMEGSCRRLSPRCLAAGPQHTETRHHEREKGNSMILALAAAPPLWHMRGHAGDHPESWACALQRRLIAS